ncbi:MAG: fused MFS/spermidine synthase [Hyphomicrobiaceae bacterium]|nr:fused MFS/spermidine synthase [Hyphomicrobiaceae bacterium]
MSSTVSSATTLARPAMTHDRVLWLYVATIFTSAFLLFAVQPIFAKMLLPKLGGAPAVWAVSMCFFQAVLLGGYFYAHALNRLLPVRTIPLVHLGVLALALLALPFGLPAGANPPENPSYVWLMSTLALGVGLPFFAISANAPLIQSWFARTGHPHAADPYFLYGASNVGSLLALLAYPFAIEPWLGLNAQSWAWTFGYVVLVALIAISGAVVMVLAKSDVATNSTADANAAPVTWVQRLIWIGLSFVPSGLLVALTTHISTDIASMPLLWVIPLAVYLITFMIAFRETPFIPDRWLSIAAGPLVAVMLFVYSMPAVTSGLIHFGLAFVTFVVLVVMNHRELYRQRPAVRHLTEFYLWMSFGGVLGGMACSLAAPQVFNSIIEYPLLMVLGLLGQAAIISGTKADRNEAMGFVILAVIAIALGLLATQSSPPSMQPTKVLVMFLIGGMITAFFFARRPHMALAACATACAGMLLFPKHANVVAQERGFFGVVLISDRSDLRVMAHGTTIHGAERLARDGGRPKPLTYYYQDSPMARGLELARSISAEGSGFRVGIVGVGVGSMACYSKPGEAWRLYDIDPLVVKLAADTRYFSFLSKCPPTEGVKLGDARLTIQAEPKASFDYLLIDAFSSDVVPVHLMTREALAMYMDRVKPGGILAIHVSSRLMDIGNVAVATAKTLPNVVVTRARTPGLPGTSAKAFERTMSDVVFVSRTPQAAEALAKIEGHINPVPNNITPWTDDYADVLGSLIRQARKQ